MKVVLKQDVKGLGKKFQIIEVSEGYARNFLFPKKIAVIADNKNLYLFGHKIIDEFKNNYNIIVSGRDLMKIYPELNYHFLITASLEERVKRKCIQYNGKINEEEVRKNIIQRDKLQEESGFYTKYKNTIVVDVTNCKTAKESANKVFDDIKMS